MILGPETSLCDEAGKKRSTYALEDFLGVSFGRENDKSVIHTREYRESAHVNPFAAVPEAYIKLVGDLPGLEAAKTRPVITTAAVSDDGKVTVKKGADYFTLTLDRLETHQTIRLLYR